MSVDDTAEFAEPRSPSDGRLRAMAGQLNAAWGEDDGFFGELLDATRSLDDASWARLNGLLKQMRDHRDDASELATDATDKETDQFTEHIILIYINS